jgi:hypothetical protein
MMTQMNKLIVVVLIATATIITPTATATTRCPSGEKLVVIEDPRARGTSASVCIPININTKRYLREVHRCMSRTAPRNRWTCLGRK